MEEQTRQETEINGWRVFLSASFFVLPILVFLMFWWSGNLERIFYITERSGWESLYRLLWCVFGSMWGFSAIAFHWRKVPQSPFPEYLTYYPVMLLVISLLIFSILHLFEKTSGYIFYYFSFVLCFMFSFLVDEFWGLFRSLLEITKSKMDK